MCTQETGVHCPLQVAECCVGMSCSTITHPTRGFEECCPNQANQAPHLSGLNEPSTNRALATHSAAVRAAALLASKAMQATPTANLILRLKRRSTFADESNKQERAQGAALLSLCSSTGTLDVSKASLAASHAERVPHTRPARSAARKPAYAVSSASCNTLHGWLAGRFLSAVLPDLVSRLYKALAQVACLSSAAKEPLVSRASAACLMTGWQLATKCLSYAGRHCQSASGLRTISLVCASKPSRNRSPLATMFTDAHRLRTHNLHTCTHQKWPAKPL